MSVAGVAISAIILGRARLGEISERMPIADAIADAETLRLYMETGRYFVGDLYPEGWLVFASRSPHYGVRKHVERGWRDRAAGRARMLARAAFRAVPGLRG